MITNTDITLASFVLREEKIYSKAEERESKDVDHPRGYIPRLLLRMNSCPLFMTTSRFGNIVVGHKKSLILFAEALNFEGQRTISATPRAIRSPRTHCSFIKKKI